MYAIFNFIIFCQCYYLFSYILQSVVNAVSNLLSSNNMNSWNQLKLASLIKFVCVLMHIGKLKCICKVSEQPSFIIYSLVHVNGLFLLEINMLGFCVHYQKYIFN